MRIIPVIDLMRGAVVRGIAGKRDEYLPIVSQLCNEPTPTTVAQAFANLGFREAYVADLDAIAGAEPDWPTYRALIDCGLELLVDAGTATSERVAELADFTYAQQPLKAVIVGLESIVSEADLAAAIEIVTPRRLAFSLDMQDGVPITNIAAWKNLSAIAIAEKAIELGVQRVILLDLAHVGTHAGVSTNDLCHKLRLKHPSLEIISGGGVRHVDDLVLLASAGCDAALVASALHDGKLSAAELRTISAS